MGGDNNLLQARAVVKRTVPKFIQCLFFADFSLFIIISILSKFCMEVSDSFVEKNRHS